MTDTEKEQVRLTAAYLNGCAVALLAMGGFGLVLATTLATTNVVDGIPSAIYGALYLVMVGSVIIHAAARLYLRQLDRKVLSLKSEQRV